jgi:hypothetical protein
VEYAVNCEPARACGRVDDVVVDRRIEHLDAHVNNMPGCEILAFFAFGRFDRQIGDVTLYIAEAIYMMRARDDRARDGWATRDVRACEDARSDLCIFDDSGHESEHEYVIMAGFFTNIWERFDELWLSLLLKYDMPHVHLKEAIGVAKKKRMGHS